jgi:uncharacterized protein YpiB (UPF0302 family)
MSFYKVLIKISNGKQVFFERISDEEISDQSKIRPIKVKEEYIDDLEGNHFIWEWYQNFLVRKDLPNWIYKSSFLEFELVRE